MTPGSFMAKIRARGYLIAGVDQSTYHFGFLNPLNGKIEGFDIDMVHAIAKAIFGNPNKVEFKAISDAQRIPEVRSGAVDIVAHTMTINCARLQAGRLLHRLLRRGPARPGLRPTPGSRASPTSAARRCARPPGPPPSPTSRPHPRTPSRSRCRSGPTAWCCCSRATSPRSPPTTTILAGLAAQDPWTKIVGPRFTSEPYGLAISQQHPDFVRFVNAVLQQLRTDGQWAASYAHWVGTPVPAPPPAHYKA